MKVKTLYTEEFNKECTALGHEIFAQFHPDVIIGVLTGGGFVGRQVAKVSPTKPIYTEIKIQRGGTSKKEKGLLHKILQCLPYSVLNVLRMLESVLLEYKSKKNNPKREGTICLPKDIISILSERKRKVLLVDDAIDSGATLLLIKQYLLNEFPNIDVKIAVITVTTRHPLVMADYYRYNNRTLIRFPWSNDIKR